jgi:hypothetical protein
MPATTYIGGQVLTSTALSPVALNSILQTLTCHMLGIDPTVDPLAYSKVRISWPTVGQPAWANTDDVCFLQATEQDDQYNRIRDTAYVVVDPITFAKTTTYTRVWKVAWTLYGPTGFDNARLLKSGLFSTGFVDDTLANQALYLVSDVSATTRSPEKFSGQWWERTDLTVRMNEQVVETLTIPAISTVEVLLYTESGLAADIVLVP